MKANNLKFKLESLESTVGKPEIDYFDQQNLSQKATSSLLFPLGPVSEDKRLSLMFLKSLPMKLMIIIQETVAGIILFKLWEQVLELDLQIILRHWPHISQHWVGQRLQVHPDSRPWLTNFLFMVSRKKGPSGLEVLLFLYQSKASYWAKFHICLHLYQLTLQDCNLN